MIMETTEKITAIYCRTASGASDDKFEIHHQEKSLLDFAERGGYCNIVSYIDNACSGLTPRPISVFEIKR